MRNARSGRRALCSLFLGLAVWFAPVRPLTAQGSWQTMAHMPTRRADLAAVTGPDGRIYAINGRTGNGVAALQLLEIHDPVTNTWATGAPPMGGHYGGRAVLGHDGLIYLMGGYYRDSSVEAYDPVAGTWTSRASMPTGRFGFAAVTGADGRIYTFGGDTGGGGENVNVVEVYDPTADSWSSLAPIPITRANQGAALGPDGRIYLIGGISYNDPSPLVYVSTVHVYSPGTDSWSTAAALPTPRNSLAVVESADGRFYAIGGENGVTLNVVEAYDPALNNW